MDLARYSKEYITGVESFLDFPYSYGDPQGYNLASHVDASSAQVVRGTNLPHSSRSDLNPVIQKLSSSVPALVDGVLNLPWSFGVVVEPFG
ncbi:hypothetical protein KY284_002981 [Solanum tuberosum]|nr:hypothetical protein KY284_002981 [Solanum tuberosum]